MDRFGVGGVVYLAAHVIGMWLTGSRIAQTKGCGEIGTSVPCW